MAKPRSRLLALALGWLLASAGAFALTGEEPFPPWKDRHEEIERALAEGEVVDLRPVGHGVTQPWRAELAIGGERLHAVWKPIDGSVRRRIKESYEAEVAAYRLSRLLGIDRVPPTVERRINRDWGSLQYWVEGCRLFSELEEEEMPRTMHWRRERSRMRLFDLLIDNPDRNAGNFLVDSQSRILMIDHSRAFAFDAYSLSKRDRPPQMFDRHLVERLETLELGDLEEVLDGLIPRYRMKAILKQRDRLLRHVEKTVAELGERVFYD